MRINVKLDLQHMWTLKGVLVSRAYLLLKRKKREGKKKITLRKTYGSALSIQHVTRYRTQISSWYTHSAFRPYQGCEWRGRFQIDGTLSYQTLRLKNKIAASCGGEINNKSSLTVYVRFTFISISSIHSNTDIFSTIHEMASQYAQENTFTWLLVSL